MKSKTKVVVVGGGVVGVSVLYHLAKKGCSDVVLVERKDLNSTIGTLLNILTKKAELVDNQSNVKVDKSIQTAS